MQTKINVDNGNISITGPFSARNNEKWRELGGKFRAGQWILPDNDTVRAVIAELFGAKSDEVEVLVPYDKYYSGGCGDSGGVLQIGGYVLASRRGRDCRVEMPGGVSLDAGSFPRSGGSVKHPRVGAGTDVVFRLWCRKSFADAAGLSTVPVGVPPTVEV